MTIHNRRRRVIATLIVLAGLAAAVAVVLRAGAHHPADLLAADIGRYLESVPEERVGIELQQLAELDRVGLLVVADALGSERACVAQSAATTLQHLLKRWRTLPHDESSVRVARLARRLAQRAEQWPSAARSVASDLALQVLNWPVDGQQVDRAALIADCEHVLRLQRAEVSHLTTPASGSEAARPVQRPRVPREAPSEERVDAGTVAASDAGGKPPVRANSVPPLPLRWSPDAEPQATAEQLPQRVPDPGRTTQDPKSSGDAGPDAGQGPTLAPPAELAPDPPAVLQLAPIRPLSGTVAPDAAADADIETGMATWSDLEVIRGLVERDTGRAADAELTLRQRGFGELDLALARKLASPDAATRRQLAENLTRLPTAAGRWLIWLSQDTDPGVRSAAVSLMVTAQDPRLVRRLREMETSEPDDDIRDQLRRWRDKQ
ncbi:MAG: hypothetical protein GXY58_16270 [Planctomycetaceae bacterium]|nr:hypothetical protein [Planctomycetaceae bacterium]